MLMLRAQGWTGVIGGGGEYEQGIDQGSSDWAME